MYDYIIATDEAHTLGRVGGANGSSHGNQKRSRKRKRDKEYGVARGIDFQGVCVQCAFRTDDPVPFLLLQVSRM